MIAVLGKLGSSKEEPHYVFEPKVPEGEARGALGCPRDPLQLGGRLTTNVAGTFVLKTLAHNVLLWLQCGDVMDPRSAATAVLFLQMYIKPRF